MAAHIYPAPISPAQSWEGCGLEGSDLFDLEALLDNCFGEAQPAGANSTGFLLSDAALESLPVPSGALPEAPWPFPDHGSQQPASPPGPNFPAIPGSRDPNSTGTPPHQMQATSSSPNLQWQNGNLDLSPSMPPIAFAPAISTSGHQRTDSGASGQNMSAPFAFSGRQDSVANLLFGQLSAKLSAGSSHGHFDSPEQHLQVDQE
ncbi:hypothetical protein WJX73_005006 [Symbiochloris irregularis]|uniref:Uncharacterized protein n=1 Tax=Symbiochloris irregularis TaxID=706552 RepID=A0AAW1NTF1_9CHLO